MTNQEKIQEVYIRANEVKQDIYDLRKEGACGPNAHSDVIRAANRLLKATDYEEVIFTKDWATCIINYKVLYNPEIMAKLAAWLK